MEVTSEIEPMDQQTAKWRPTAEEVEQIRRELRPLIRDLARRDQEAIAKEIFRRRLARIG
jgi:hypothetical protein